jgi:predicted transcriptional regulator
MVVDGNDIRRARKLLGMTQQDLAKTSGVPAFLVRLLDSGTIDKARARLLAALGLPFNRADFDAWRKP